ncbi:MAG: hypothetical protein AB7O37_20585 [Vicinamibacteria bacterium]
MIPGAGQMYRGRVGAGLAWLFVVAFGYLALFLPGLVLHLVCVVNAASSSAVVSHAGSATSAPESAGGADARPPARTGEGCALAAVLALLVALLAFGFVRMLGQRAAPASPVSDPARSR